MHSKIVMYDWRWTQSKLKENFASHWRWARSRSNRNATSSKWLDHNSDGVSACCSSIFLFYPTRRRAHGIAPTLHVAVGSRHRSLAFQLVKIKSAVTEISIEGTLSCYIGSNSNGLVTRVPYERPQYPINPINT